VTHLKINHRTTTILFVLSFWLVACSAKHTSELDIPAGFATQTLKEFAKQAEVEIIFDPQSVYGVKTNPVGGSHEPRAALRIMLRGTPLTVDFDEETGAYAVIRIDLSRRFIGMSGTYALVSNYNGYK
jgi:type II secretory pathway component PulC